MAETVNVTVGYGFGAHRRGPTFDEIEFDWPPRLTFEHQQAILYEAMQRHVRFTGWGGSNLFDLLPRRNRQLLYRRACG